MIAPVVVGALVVPIVALIVRMWRRSRGTKEPDPGASPAGDAARPVPSRSRRADVVVVVAALTLVALGGVGAHAKLDTDPAPPPLKAGAIGVVPPGAPPPKDGFAVSAGVRFKDCGKPVDVTLVVGGTAEWWMRYARRMGATEELRIGIPTRKDRDDISDAISDVSVDLTVDGTEGFLRPLTQSGLRRARFRKSLQNEGRFTEVQVTVKDWGRSIHPVVVRFKADWLDPRAEGSCYASIPAITGGRGVFAAQDVRGEARSEDLSTGGEVVDGPGGLAAPDEPRLESTRGLVSLDVGKHNLDDDLSLPEPDAQLYGLPMWTCSRRPPGTPALLEERPRDVPEFLTTGDGATVLSNRHVDRWIDAGDCSATAVLEEKGSARSRDLWLLIFAALFSLGATILVELLLEWWGRRRSAAAVG